MGKCICIKEYYIEEYSYNVGGSYTLIFYKDKIYNFIKRKKSLDLFYSYSIIYQKDNDAINLNFKEDDFNKNFIELSEFREQRINSILNE